MSRKLPPPAARQAFDLALGEAEKQRGVSR